MYQDASAGGSNSNKTSNSADQAAQALDLMVKALQILDDGDIDPVVGARLDHAIEILREEIGRTSWPQPAAVTPPITENASVR